MRLPWNHSTSIAAAHCLPGLCAQSVPWRRADLKATFGSKRHELNVSTYQMVVLLLFNSADRLSYHEIAAATAIPPADLKRSLQSLACVKARAAPKVWF